MMATRRGQRPAPHPADSILHSPLGQFAPERDGRSPRERVRDFNTRLQRSAGPWPLDTDAPSTRVREVGELHREGRLPDEGEGPQASMAAARKSRLRAQSPWATPIPPTFRDPSGGGGRG